MAFSDRTEEDVYDLRDALEREQEKSGDDDFTAGAMAVCTWLTEYGISTVEDFLRMNDML